MKKEDIVKRLNYLMGEIEQVEDDFKYHIIGEVESLIEDIEKE
ncbi:hypothetical protein [Priestia megaterium]|nr:hypothetical protein [Priestia megaterium]